MLSLNFDLSFDFFGFSCESDCTIDYTQNTQIMSRVEDEDEVEDDDDEDDVEQPNNQHQLTGTGAKYHQH